MKKVIKLAVNGKQYDLEVRPSITLAELLRNEVGLKGTKIACDEGVCGSCTVLLDGRPVKSCSVLAPQAEGRNIVTIEGLSNGDRLDPLQESFIKNHGMECGYCTSGMILAAKALLDENPNPTEPEVREAIQGHICRCGVYPSITASILDAAKVMREEKND